MEGTGEKKNQSNLWRAVLWLDTEEVNDKENWSWAQHRAQYWPSFLTGGPWGSNPDTTLQGVQITEHIADNESQVSHGWREKNYK